MYNCLERLRDLELLVLRSMRSIKGLPADATGDAEKRLVDRVYFRECRVESVPGSHVDRNGNAIKEGSRCRWGGKTGIIRMFAAVELVKGLPPVWHANLGSDSLGLIPCSDLELIPEPESITETSLPITRIGDTLTFNGRKWQVVWWDDTGVIINSGDRSEKYNPEEWANLITRLKKV